MSGLAGVVSGVVGFGVGRVAGVSEPPGETPAQHPVSNQFDNANGVLSLGQVKPWDIERPRMLFLHNGERRGYGGHADLDDFLVASDERLIYDIRATKRGDQVSIPIDGATFLSLGVPESFGPVSNVSVQALSGEQPPVLERLVDRGIPSDIAALVAANGRPPTIGELWLFTARDKPWGIGDYELAVSARTNFAFRFRIGPAQ